MNKLAWTAAGLFVLSAAPVLAADLPAKVYTKAPAVVAPPASYIVTVNDNIVTSSVGDTAAKTFQLTANPGSIVINGTISDGPVVSTSTTKSSAGTVTLREQDALPELTVSVAEITTLCVAFALNVPA